MREAREICDKNHYSNLVIPTARIHGGFIIESRLPIMREHDTKSQIGFYIDHVEDLTQSVEEFTGFLCQAKLEDITGGTNDPYSTLSEVRIARYDNVAMYVENETGKLGLIDLEGFSPKSKSEQQQTFSVCQELVRLFPYHLDAILKTAMKFDPHIADYRKKLEEHQSYILDYFDKAYLGHLNLVKQKKH